MFLDETPYPNDLSLDWVFWHSCHWYLSGEEQEYSIDPYQRARLEGSLFPYINLSPFGSTGKPHLVFQGSSRNNEEYWFYTITHSPKSIILCLKKKLKNKVLHFVFCSVTILLRQPWWISYLPKLGGKKRKWA